MRIKIEWQSLWDGILLVVVLGAMVGLVWLIGYGIYHHETGIKAGYVYDKGWSQGHTSVSTHCNKDVSGQVTDCTTTSDTYPATYTLYVRDDKATNWINVPYEMWSKTKLGEWFDGNCFCVVPR